VAARVSKFGLLGFQPIWKRTGRVGHHVGFNTH
jgi:hypothetical protein